MKECHRYDPHFEGISDVDRKWRNNRNESDHVALKRLLATGKSFRSLRSAKATLMAIETIRAIKQGHIRTKQPSVLSEINFVPNLVGVTA